MPFLEYMLLAILGATPAATPTRTLTADAVTQPAGGASGDPGQKKPRNAGVASDTTGKEPTKTRTVARHHRRGHKGKVYESHKKVTNTSKF